MTAIGGAGSCVVVRKNIETRPNRRETKLIIPGKNGAEYINDECFDNVPASYSLVFTDFSKIDAVVNYLLGQRGFFRLEDDYDTDIYRVARVSSANPRTDDRRMGFIELVFECKPQKYLKPTTALPEMIDIQDSAVHEIENPTAQTSKPLIRVYGDNGEVKIRLKLDAASVYKYSFTVADGIYPTVNSIVVDSDKEDVYANDINYNSYVTFTGTTHDFPLLEGYKQGVTNSNVTQISITGDISRIVIYPRWWKL